MSNGNGKKVNGNGNGNGNGNANGAVTAKCSRKGCDNRTTYEESRALWWFTQVDRDDLEYFQEGLDAEFEVEDAVGKAQKLCADCAHVVGEVLKRLGIRSIMLLKPVEFRKRLFKGRRFDVEADKKARTERWLLVLPSERLPEKFVGRALQDTDEVRDLLRGGWVLYVAFNAREGHPYYTEDLASCLRAVLRGQAGVREPQEGVEIHEDLLIKRGRVTRNVDKLKAVLPNSRPLLRAMHGVELNQRTFFKMAFNPFLRQLLVCDDTVEELKLWWNAMVEEEGGVSELVESTCFLCKTALETATRDRRVFQVKKEVGSAGGAFVCGQCASIFYNSRELLDPVDVEHAKKIAFLRKRLRALKKR